MTPSLGPPIRPRSRPPWGRQPHVGEGPARPAVSLHTAPCAPKPQGEESPAQRGLREREPGSGSSPKAAQLGDALPRRVPGASVPTRPSRDTARP